MRQNRAVVDSQIGVPASARRLTPAAMGAVLGVALLLALVPKLLCLEELAAGEPERHWCFSDLKRLYDQRGFDVDAVPYADPPPGYPVDYVFEYPPGVALPAYGLARLADTRLEFFALNAATLLLAAIAVAWALARALVALRRPRERLLLYVASPSLVVFALHTWDLWSVAPAAGGLAAAASGRRRLAGALFGLGAAVKWWPALLVVLLLFGPWSGKASSGTRGRWRWERIAPAAIAAGVWALVQVPALIVSPSNWWASIAVHLRRPPNIDGFYGVLAWLGKTIAPSSLWGEPFTLAVGVLGAAGLLAGVAYIARRLDRGSLTPGDAALGLVVVFMLTSKVVSPQFILWLLPVAVISTTSWSRLLAVEIPNIGVWFALAGQVFSLGLYRPLAVARTFALAWMLFVALRRRSREDESRRADVARTAAADRTPNDRTTAPADTDRG
jgi:Glycosyltransferase family 87